MIPLIDKNALFREMEKASWYNNADRDEVAEELVLNAPIIEVDTDTVSRQAAIDALVGITMFKTKHEIMQRVNASVQDEQGWLGAIAECLDEIEDMPSAEPEKRTEERTETHGVCLDAIDRQVVIDTVRKIILGFFSDEDGAMTDTEKTLLSVSKAVCNGVRELPSAQPEIMKWIPCSERLPEGKQEVLVTEYGDTDMGRRFDGRWVDRYGDKMKDVTAWMPLPEPYHNS